MALNAKERKQYMKKDDCNILAYLVSLYLKIDSFLLNKDVIFDLMMA
jgi:hypothetical protein